MNTITLFRDKSHKMPVTVVVDKIITLSPDMDTDQVTVITLSGAMQVLKVWHTIDEIKAMTRS